ncbi:ATP-binding protein [Polluticoccus soli]|uniref:ATP-binding protein n=1 Tax=Polluticoccus soli TaxID=3034150 RepID=UPI0023E2758A|nr:ATP-binding protein [Flavipsychrobacter sp. JY13-12]
MLIGRSLILLLSATILVCFTSCKEQARYEDKQPSKTSAAYLEQAVQIGDSGFHRRALHYLDSAYSTENKISPVDKYYYYAFFFNTYNHRLKELDKATRYADSMLLIAEQNEKEYGKMLAEANYAKGDVHLSRGEYSEAYGRIYKAKTLVRNNLDSCGLSDYSYRLGMILYKQKRYAEAGEQFKQAFYESDKCPDVFLYFYRRQELLDNVGLCYTKTGDYDSALHYFNKTIAFVEEQKIKYPERNPAVYGTAKAVVYGNMADAYVSQGNDSMAEALYKRSIDTNTLLLHDNVDAQRTRLKLAALQLSDNEMDKAGGLLQQVKTISDTLHDNAVTLRWYDLMWQYHQKKGEPAVAFNFLLKHKHIDDSINSVTREFVETDINERFKNMDKQFELEILKKNNELKQNYIILMIVGAVLSIIILGLIYVNWRKSKKNVEKLTELNDQINAQNQHLEKLLKELEQSNKEKDRILRVVAHDIRNPISAILALTQFLLTEHENYTPDQKELLELINEACSNAMTLTKDILEAATPEQTGPLEKEWVDINALLANSINLLRFKADEKKQTIDLALPEAPISLYINKEKIWRVINNLVINAVKFSNTGAKIIVTAERDKDNLRISVKDSGIGIPDNMKNKVFDMFTDAKRYGTAGEKSFGLGLSICRQIIQDHGGSITFESQENKGTTFAVILPIDSIAVSSRHI